MLAPGDYDQGQPLGHMAECPFGHMVGSGLDEPSEQGQVTNAQDAMSKMNDLPSVWDVPTPNFTDFGSGFSGDDDTKKDY